MLESNSLAAARLSAAICKDEGNYQMPRSLFYVMWHGNALGCREAGALINMSELKHCVYRGCRLARLGLALAVSLEIAFMGSPVYRAVPTNNSSVQHEIHDK